MDNFKFNFLSWDQLVSSSLDKFFTNWYEVFLVTYFLPLMPECSAEIILNLSLEVTLYILVV